MTRSLVARVVALLAAGTALIIVARTAMAAPPAMQREAVGLIVVTVLAEALLGRLRLDLRLLAAGDEGWQPVDVAGIVRLLLRLLLRERLGVARQIGLRLARPERSVGAAHRLLLAVVLLVERLIAGAARHLVLGPRQMRIVLAELLLGGGDQPIVVLGMLIVVFS